MQVACAEHLSLPRFATLKYKQGEKSARTFSQTCTLCFGFSRKTLLSPHGSKIVRIPQTHNSGLQQVYYNFLEILLKLSC